MKHIKKISDYAKVGGLSALLVTGLVGCGDSNSNNQQGQNNAFSNASQKQGAFVVIEALPNGGYTIVDEYPSNDTRIVLKELNGNERILSQEEIDRLVKEEAIKIDNGTSGLTNPEVSSGNMGLGGVLLSSIAGAMIGSWIGNKLFNNQNYQNQRRTQYKSPQTFSRSVDSFNKAKTASTASSSSKKSGFFGSKSKTSSSSSSFGSRKSGFSFGG
ncbi:UPF0323 family lipoprotein [Candidatus Marinarcus aquaticus]|uniref:UPF0323 domain-containing protein n=1 Tax=Candidatus Marinarcus aquaticus TaxID=2044504 RepID=A0A4Q0XVC7_9BACT|nr:UPF0323 family lipoprotein [Candidatus Marinarcus aquaticus]RXJ60149.1 hypothetical protein CRV04_03865 [Candidatus Marinarcus aquaticus]